VSNAGFWIGTAGWSIPLANADMFPSEGTGLERYSARFRCAEINSSFHRSHRPATYERWAAAVPEDFRFSVKMPKAITHQQRLVDTEELVEAFLGEIIGLGSNAELLLVQLPPSFAFDRAVAEPFFNHLRNACGMKLACEPRHASWFEGEADALLSMLEVARVAADPAKVEAAAVPGGWRGITYFRLHGSPVIYRSSYDDDRLKAYAAAIEADWAAGKQVWCIFDNTASSAGAGDALRLQEMLRDG
jgi:uncharacterized protein YecE (DUF72 family)